MKTLVLLTFLTITTVYSNAQKQQDSISIAQNPEEQLAKLIEIQNHDISVYKLFPTENHWTFIKLDTRNGKMWQVHFTVSKDGYQGELTLNSTPLNWDGKDINGRFNLYPTKNMYNFILLDQIKGRTYQVQWNNDEENRLVIPIY